MVFAFSLGDWWPKIKSFLESDPVILIKDGIIDNIKMKEQEISFDELEETVREHGVEKIENVIQNCNIEKLLMMTLQMGRSANNAL